MPRRSPRQPDRAATEAALQKAALALLERNGVLAGLNLREVAEEAGVNRGLVYHYFGSRRALLRAALRSDIHERIGDFEPGFSKPLAARISLVFRTYLRHRRAVTLTTLLALDGDTLIRIIPDLEGTRRRMARDVADGHMAPDMDTEATHVALSALIYGYLVFRERYAAELDCDVQELDDRLAATVERLLLGVAPPPASETTPSATA
jgi:AcrR family transcriptional regulator